MGNKPIRNDHMSAAEINREIGMMQDPDAWPQWPYLPLKRHVEDGPDQMAYLYDVGVDKKGQVVAGELDFVMRKGAWFLATDEDEEVEIENFTKLVQEGWLVD